MKKARPPAPEGGGLLFQMKDRRSGLDVRLSPLLFVFMIRAATTVCSPLFRSYGRWDRRKRCSELPIRTLPCALPNSLAQFPLLLNEETRPLRPLPHARA